jgi:hypothetical protein
MKAIATSALMILFATGASAQATPSTDDAKQAQIAADPGRPRYDDRGGLSGRGGPNATGSDKTYSATIGSQIYSTIGTPIAPQLPSNPR